MKPLFSNADLKKLVIPLIIEQTLSVLVGIADVIMVSQAGEAAVSGVSLVDSLNYLLMLVFNSAATGGAIITSHYLGAKNKEKARESAEQLLLATFFLSLLVALPSVLWNRPILGFIYGSIEPDVMTSARMYYYMTAASYPFMAIYSACAAICRTMGDSKTSMKISMVMNLVNVCGNALFVFFLHMGAAGVGLATLLSRIVAAVCMLSVVRNPDQLLHIRKDLRLRPNFSIIKDIMRIGIPTGVENSMFQVGKVLVASLVASFGTVATAANAVANNITMFQCIPGGAIGLAMITVIGQCVGAADFEQARKYEKKLMTWIILLHFIINVPLLFLLRPFIGLYNLSPEAFELALWIAFSHGILVIPLWPYSFALPNSLRAAGDVRFTMTVSILSMGICRICGAFLFGRYLGLGLIGVWCAMYLDWIVRCACFQGRILTGKWLAKAKAKHA